MNTFTKIILGNIFRTLLTALITFFVTKHVLAADVATHLMRGDTVALWNGSLNLNLAMVINVLVGLCVPILVPIGIGISTRVVSAYKTIVARAEAFSMTKDELNSKVKQASIGEIIKTVATESA